MQSKTGCVTKMVINVIKIKYFKNSNKEHYSKISPVYLQSYLLWSPQIMKQLHSSHEPPLR